MPSHAHISIPIEASRARNEIEEKEENTKRHCNLSICFGRGIHSLSFLFGRSLIFLRNFRICPMPRYGDRGEVLRTHLPWRGNPGGDHCQTASPIWVLARFPDLEISKSVFSNSEKMKSAQWAAIQLSSKLAFLFNPRKTWCQLTWEKHHTRRGEVRECIRGENGEKNMRIMFRWWTTQPWHSWKVISLLTPH